MNKNIIFSFGCALTIFVTNSAISQVNKEVEVTQAYIPKIQEATKPTLTPNMDDDAYIAPDIDYSITSTSIHTPLENEPYKPVELDYSEYRRLGDHYAKVGVGLPWRSVVDLYASKSSSSRGYFNAFINQEGEYAQITDDYGVKNCATESHLRVGTTAGLYHGRRVLEGAFDYRNDCWSRYATSGSEDLHPLYQSLGLNVRYGDNFTDLSRWNYSLTVGAEQMWSRSNYRNTAMGAELNFGHNLIGGGVTLSGSINYIGGSDRYRNTTVGVGARYDLEGVVSNLSLGVDLYSDNVSQRYLGSDPRFIVTPHLHFDQRIVESKFIAYLDFGGDIQHNDYASLSRRNPYIEAGMFGERSSVSYNLDMGVKGAIGERAFSYNIYVGYSIMTNEAYWVYSEQQTSSSSSNNNYLAFFDDLRSLSLDVELLYRPTTAFEFGVTTSLNRFYSDNATWEVARPAATMSIWGGYKVGGLTLGMGGELESKRSTSQIYCDVMGEEIVSSITTPAAFNMMAKAEYRLKSGVVMFCEITNLLNREIYEWTRYREYGVGGLVGVKFEF